MKHFNKLIINGQNEILGEGYYEKGYDELIVEADSSILNAFDDMFDNRVIINNIEFEGSNGEYGGFNGPYLIRRIRNNVVTLQK
ncbi:hypothetical protein [Bacillus atrophaeus]|uniref:hypothetical protein n=1 Tax=Bacillus atrophaeus TaxID=1452 RepID=UPI003873BD89